MTQVCTFWDSPGLHLIDCWIVNNLICDMQISSWILLPGFVCHLHCSLHPPAVPISLSQLDLDVLHMKSISQVTQGGLLTYQGFHRTCSTHDCREGLRWQFLQRPSPAAHPFLPGVAILAHAGNEPC